MKLNQTYDETATIRELLIAIEAQKRAVTLFSKPKHLETKIRRAALLKSAVYSARIEGNPLTEEAAGKLTRPARNLEQLEIQNVLETLTWLYQNPIELVLSLKLIKEIHAKIVHNLRQDAGSFRKEQSAIYDPGGRAIYLTPLAEEIPMLLKQWISRLKTSKEPVPILVAMAHYQFEKIHPFIDGNGRVGRLLTTQLLRQSGCDFEGLLNLEEYIDETRNEYYAHLMPTTRNITPFVEYFLKAIAAQAGKVLSLLAESPKDREEDSLLPRRREILLIIRDHRVVSFDFLKRRFMRVPASTLRYDLRQLAQGGYIRKLGKTRGAQYVAVE